MPDHRTGWIRHLRVVIGLLLVLMLLSKASSLPVHAQAVLSGRVGVTSQQGLIPDGILQRLLMANHLSRQLVSSISIENSGTALNAYTNGHTIVVTRALWQGLTTDDMKAFVLGHELAHVVLHHVEKTQARRLGLALINQFVIQQYIPAGSLLGQFDSVGLSLLDRRFSRNVEYQADDLGLTLMQKAGYNPNAALAVFRFLGQHSGNSTPEFLSDHPISESRIRNLVSRYNLRG